MNGIVMESVKRKRKEKVEDGEKRKESENNTQNFLNVLFIQITRYNSETETIREFQETIVDVVTAVA